MAQEPGTSVPFEQENVRGFLHLPSRGAERGLVLTHGAGGNCGSPLLAAVAEAFCSEGIGVLRCDLPFRQKRPRGPPSPGMAAADRAGLRSAAQAMRAFAPGKIYLGGLSYGGRQASMLAEEPGVAEALLLLSYPLHPPGKPDQSRTGHFPQIHVPAIFVHGTSDPFGTTGELELAMSMIPATTRFIPVQGAGHELKHGRFDLQAIVIALLETDRR